MRSYIELVKEADAAEQEETDGEQGKEFYTIQMASEKVFFLIIDRDGDDEKVYFLTEISENDLLNTIDTTSETLPMNSAALDNGIPTDSALPNNIELSDDATDPVSGEEITEEGENEEESTPVEEEKKPIKDSTFGTYILFGVLGTGVIIVVYFLKIKKKKDDYLDEDDDSEEEPETFENEDEEEDFFSQQNMPQTSEEDVTETIDDEEQEDEE